MDINQIKSQLIQWFVENASIDEITCKENSSKNYFELGYIDSFSFLSMIVAIQEEFGIELGNEDFEDGKFVTIDGMASIIYKKVNS